MSVWVVTDNKPGHVAQIDGLLTALIEIDSGLEIKYFATSGSVGDLSCESKPRLIIAAGNRTHWRALVFKWRFKAPLVVLMKPSLPLFLFDLCIVPEHDYLQQDLSLPSVSARQMVFSKGPLNALKPKTTQFIQHHGLLLIGGPSKHYSWCAESLLQQLDQLFNLMPNIEWVLTTSRRTPKAFITQLQARQYDNVLLKPVEQTDKAWLQQQYQESPIIWVTEDSASMVYESLSTGAQVGILTMPLIDKSAKLSRVSLGVKCLLNERRVSCLESLQQNNGTMLPSKQPLQEASRIAEMIYQRLIEDSANG